MTIDSGIWASRTSALWLTCGMTFGATAAGDEQITAFKAGAISK